jgi:LuxR family maltose regulon positive regulatory protein
MGGGMQPRELSPVVHAHLGSVHVAQGNLHLAAATFLSGSRGPTASPGRAQCASRLAHVLALQGDLRRAEEVARSAAAGPPWQEASPGHLELAQAWLALERGDLARASELVSHFPEPDGTERDEWAATSGLLLRAQLLIATGEPEAAGRLLAAAEARGRATGDSWLTEQLAIGRAEALLASGDVHRALAGLTPLPVHAGAAALVLTAAARLTIGDARGARSVLAQAEDELDGAPLGLQVHALLLGSRLADERGDQLRADTLLDKALHAAALEGLRRPLLRDWAWVRRRVDRNPALLRSHRELLGTCELRTPGVPHPRLRPNEADAPPTAPLTGREEEVLGLLALMYSTEEIASELFISTNTVKTHLKGIFGKLCVNRRVDAVRRGRQLGLC